MPGKKDAAYYRDYRANKKETKEDLVTSIRSNLPFLAIEHPALAETISETMDKIVTDVGPDRQDDAKALSREHSVRVALEAAGRRITELEDEIRYLKQQLASGQPIDRFDLPRTGFNTRPFRPVPKSTKPPKK